MAYLVDDGLIDDVSPWLSVVSVSAGGMLARKLAFIVILFSWLDGWFGWLVSWYIVALGTKSKY